MVVNKSRQNEFLKSLDRKKKQEKQLEQESKKLNNQQKKQNEQKKKQSGGGQKRGSANRGTKQTGGGSAAKSNGGGNAFGGLGTGQKSGSANIGTLVGSFGGVQSRASKSGGISLKPAAAEALSNRLNTVSGKSGKNNLDEIYGRILDKRYQEYLAEQKRLQRQKTEEPKYRNNGDYIRGVSVQNVKKAKAELGRLYEDVLVKKYDKYMTAKQQERQNGQVQGNAEFIKRPSAEDAERAIAETFEAIPDDVKHTAKAFGKGAMAEVNNVGALPFSVINSLSGGKLADKSDLVRVLLENRDQINEEFQEELAAIDSMPLRVIGSLGYAVPDILLFKGLGAAAGGVKGAELAAKGVQAANLGSKGGFLVDVGNGAKALVSPKNAKVAAAYGGKYFDENLRSGMEPDEALRSAALQAAAASVFNEAGYSPVFSAKGWIGDGTKGVVTDFVNRAARAANDPDGSGDWLGSALDKENLLLNFSTGVLNGGVGRVGGKNNNSILKVKNTTAKGIKSNSAVGNYKKSGGGPLSERALQEAWIEDVLRKYYWSH